AAKVEQIWNSIKGNKRILELATSVVKDKWGERDTFLASAIAECMLIDHNLFQKTDPNQISFFDDSVDNKLYQDLVNKIYANTDLARIVLDGYANGGSSFLLKTLLNESLELTADQKAFAIEEAMHKIGTTEHQNLMVNYEQDLAARGISDDITVIAPEFGLMGAKTFNTYVAGIFASMNTNQAHGRGEFDIRYYLLKNPNFANEMPKLVYDFFADDTTYDAIVDYWEWDIINFCRSEEDDDEPVFYLDELLFISDAEILARLPYEQAINIINEVNFIKKLHKIRPPQYRHLEENEEAPMQKVLV
ncbi:MAG TPA: hypothetical protein PK737_02060, partial [Bacilli bacterium]|nr:hypothetical protein [Bacilli bacterium]